MEDQGLEIKNISSDRDLYLISKPKLWKFLEQSLNEDLSGLNKAYLKFRSIYQSGRRFSGKEWIELMAELLDEVD